MTEQGNTYSSTSFAASIPLIPGIGSAVLANDSSIAYEISLGSDLLKDRTLTNMANWARIGCSPNLQIKHVHSNIEAAFKYSCGALAGEIYGEIKVFPISKIGDIEIGARVLGAQASNTFLVNKRVREIIEQIDILVEYYNSGTGIVDLYWH